MLTSLDQPLDTFTIASMISSSMQPDCIVVHVYCDVSPSTLEAQSLVRADTNHACSDSASVSYSARLVRCS